MGPKRGDSSSSSKRAARRMRRMNMMQVFMVARDARVGTTEQVTSTIHIFQLHQKRRMAAVRAPATIGCVLIHPEIFCTPRLEETSPTMRKLLIITDNLVVAWSIQRYVIVRASISKGDTKELFLHHGKMGSMVRPLREALKI